MFNLGEIGAAVTLDDSDYVMTLNGLEQKTNAIFKKIGGIAAGFLGFRQIAKYAKDAVSAYITQENAVNSLERSLWAIGQGNYSKRLQELAASLQQITTYGDEATLQVMTMGINMGISTEKIEDATKAAMGLAAKYQQLDFSTAMQLIAKAANGNTARLKMFGITLDETKTKTEQFNDLLKQGNDAFPLAKAETFGQHLQQIQNAWADLSEQVGKYIIALFDLDETSGGVLGNITKATAWLNENLEAVAYEIKYVFSYFEEGVKSAYALFEPIVLYLYNSVKDLATNIISLGQWAFDNADKIVDALPDLFVATLQDIYGAFKKTFEMIQDLGVNFVKALWDTIRHGSTQGWSNLWDELQSDFADALAANFEHKAGVIQAAGIAELPDMQKTAFIGDVVDMYKNLENRIDGIHEEGAKKRADLDEWIYQQYEKKRNQNNEKGNGKLPEDPVEATKNNVAGSFSAAVLTGMLGAGSAQMETAKNTKRMVEEQKATNEKLSAFTYG